MQLTDIIPYDIIRIIILQLPPDSILTICCVNKYIKNMNLNSWLTPKNMAAIHISKVLRSNKNLYNSVQNRQMGFINMAYSNSKYNEVHVRQWIVRYYMALFEELIGCGVRNEYPYHYYHDPRDFNTRSRRISFNKEYNILRNIKYLKRSRYYDIYQSLTLRSLID